MSFSAPTLLVTLVFLAQILVISVLVPYQFHKAYSSLKERYPPDAYPRLYPVAPGRDASFNAILAVTNSQLLAASMNSTPTDAPPAHSHSAAGARIDTPSRSLHDGRRRVSYAPAAIAGPVFGRRRARSLVHRDCAHQGRDATGECRGNLHLLQHTVSDHLSAHRPGGTANAGRARRQRVPNGNDLNMPGTPLGS
jgi:hypothetical protein